MKGYLDMKAMCTGMSRVVPLYRYHRQRGTEHQMNLHPCTAKYHGHKLHGPE